MKNIHSMSIEEINKKAKEVRETLIETVSKNGGHLSSNLGIVELTLCLHNVFDFSKDRLLLMLVTNLMFTSYLLEEIRSFLLLGKEEE